MKQLFSLLTAMSLSLVGLAQSTGKITGIIKDGGNQKIIDAATISLLKAKDSSLVKAAVTDKEGNFQFEEIQDGDYLVLATSVGHSKVYSKPFTVSEAGAAVNVGILQLVPTSKSLKEVVVASKRPFIERKIDKTIVNVDASISNAGSTVMEVLEKSPGVTVDKDGNVSLKGKPSVVIMIDGKPSYLNGEELANFLRSMSSSTIDQIELITNPSAKYDAAGNAGVINIKTKKNKQRGFNGSLNLSYGQAVYARTTNSLVMNYRNGKFNVFGTLSGNYRQSFQDIDILRNYKNDDHSLKAIFQQNAFTRYTNQNYYSKLGMDFYATKKTTVGFVLSGFTTPNTNEGTSTIYRKNSSSVLDSVIIADSKEKSTWRNGNINLNFRHQFDSTGRELTADADYITYSSNNDQNFTNATYTPEMLFKDQDELIGELPSDITIYSVKTDYTHPLKSGLKIESGLKSSYVTTDNTARYFNVIDHEKLPDEYKTNQFQYKENINAAYINFSKEIKKWSIQAGLRLENTNYKGYQKRQDSSFKNDYTSLFPTLYVNYNANEKNQYGFSYGRRINRPDYADLNPFLSFLDKFTYSSGNPFLKPSYANAFEVSHTYKQFLTTTLNYTHTKDLFTETFEQKGDTSIVRQGNYGKTDNVTLSVTAQVPVVKWWTAVLYGEGNYTNYRGSLYGEKIDLDATTFLVNVNNQFQFKKGWSAELSGFYRTKGIEGQIVVKPLAQVNLGIQKQVLKNKATLKLNVRDVFYSMQEKGNINFNNTEAYFHQKKDSG